MDTADCVNSCFTNQFSDFVQTLTVLFSVYSWW
jgi:hypothetical protein